MIKATLVRTTFNWGWLTGSEVQSIVIKAGSRAACRQLDESLIAHTHNDTPNPRPYLLKQGHTF